MEWRQQQYIQCYLQLESQFTENPQTQLVFHRLVQELLTPRHNKPLKGLMLEP